MKKLLLALVISFTFLGAFTQAPSLLNYQAVIRDAGNNLVVSQPVGLKISILQGSSTGIPVYSETQFLQTNVNGLLTIQIGGGSAIAGKMDSINWA